MIRFTLLIAFIIFSFVPSSVFAETKEIISEGTYNMGDGETPSVAESRALLKARKGWDGQANVWYPNEEFEQKLAQFILNYEH